MFLSVDSSMVVIVWEKRRVLWGSMYLDRHGEEDKDLKSVGGGFIYVAHGRRG